MAGKFFGEHVNKVDGKGRVSIPSDFRVVLQENDPKFDPQAGARLTLNYGLKEGTLIGYTMAEAEKLARQIEDMPFGEERDFLDLAFGSMSRVLTVDETGRIVLPQVLREAAGLEGEAVFLGKLSTFEVVRPALNRTAAERVQEMRAKLRSGNPLELLNRTRAEG